MAQIDIEYFDPDTLVTFKVKMKDLKYNLTLKGPFVKNLIVRNNITCKVKSQEFSMSVSYPKRLNEMVELANIKAGPPRGCFHIQTRCQRSVIT